MPAARGCLRGAAILAWLALVPPTSAAAGPDSTARRATFVVAPEGTYRAAMPETTFTPPETERCLVCHGEPDLVVRDTVSGTVRPLTVDAATFARSAHGTIACTACHPDVRAWPHVFEGGRPRVGCDADCHARDARGQPVRHDAAVADQRRSAHAQGLDGRHRDLPDCTYCHGEGDPHAVAAAPGALEPELRMAQCASCHDDRERMIRNGVDPEAVASYRRSFHYKAVRLRSRRAAVCGDCHTAHRVMAPDDTSSTVNATHLPRTCGQTRCHPGAELRFAQSGANHLTLRIRRDPVLALTETLLLWIGTIVVVVLAAGVAFDALRRFGRAPAPAAPDADRARPVDEPMVLRLSRAQRLQHGVLVACFTALALSGLPLRFPDIQAFRALGFGLGGLTVAHSVHRAAGALLILLGIVHAVYALALLARRRFDVRVAWPMLPGRDDVRDAWQMVRWHLRLRPSPPEFDRHEFRHKLHYFAALFGVPAMALSGLMLWFPVFFGNRLPDRAFAIAHLVHGEEALVAVLVVVVWHMYLVHVAPGTHHRFMTWLDGRITRAAWVAQHGREAARVRTPALVPPPEPRGALERATPWLLATILVVAALMRVREAVRTPFWFDELFTLWMARHPLPETMALLPGDIHPPLPTLLVSLWLAVAGDHALWLKSLPLLLGLLAVAATFGFARSLFGRGTALLAAALLALHPSHIYFSQELRGYGLLTLVLLLTAWAAWRWTVTGRWRHALAWMTGAALALYTHYLGAVVVALVSLYALASTRGSRPRFVTWLVVHAGLLLLVSPLLWLLPGQMRLSHETWLGAPPGADLVDLARKITFGAYYLVPVFGVLAMLPLVRAPHRRAAVFAWWMGIGAVVLTFLLSLRGPHLFASRYMYFTLPYWCTLFAAGLLALPWRRAIPVAVTLTLLLDLRAAMLRPPLAEAVDLRNVARIIAPQLRDGDVVFCADTHSLLCLDHYLAAGRPVLITDDARVPYYAGGAIFTAARIVPLDSLRATVRDGGRWWAVHTREHKRMGDAAAALFDSLAADALPLATTTVWASSARMLAGPSAAAGTVLRPPARPVADAGR